MPSLRSLSKYALGSLGASQSVFAANMNSMSLNALSSCPSPELSCHNTTAQENLCCFNSPGGALLQTQFWDTNPPTGPDDSWTLHGLWPDNCDGTYEANCDPRRAYTNITEILQAAGADETMLDLLRWHGAEEVEHRAVAFDVFQHLDGRYHRRVLAYVFGGPALVWLWVRLVLLAAPALVLEELGLVAAIRRAHALSRGQFWRLLGVALLAGLIAGVVGQVVAVPFTVVGAVAALLLPPSWSLPGLLLVSNLGSVVTGALVGPFSAGVTGLQYVDQRFRKEGLDITLLDETLRR